MLKAKITLVNYVFIGIFIVSGKRTAFGAFGGTLKNHSANDLQEIANRAAIEAIKLNPELIDSVFVGNVMQVILWLIKSDRSIYMYGWLCGFSSAHCSLFPVSNVLKLEKHYE